MPDLTPIDHLYADYTSLIEYLDSQNQVTLSNNAGNSLRRVLVLAIGAYFEKVVLDLVEKLTIQASNNHPLLVPFVRKKAIERQYHTYFEWNKQGGSNRFFSLFGDDFKASVIF